MSIYFADTSAIAKRYINEVGSAWIRALTTPDSEHLIVISDLTPVEFVSSLARRQREGTITAEDFVILQSSFLSHYANQYLYIALQNSVLARARHLLTLYPLRTLDAIQLASAIEFVNAFGEPAIFISADNNLLSAAADAGFITDNPLNHP